MSLARNLSAVTVADLVGKVVPLITLPLVVRALGADGYGRIGFTAATVGFFALAASPGFIPWGIREAAKNPGREVEIASAVTTARVCFAVLAVMALAAFTFTVAPPGPKVRLLLMLYGLQILASCFGLEWLLNAKQRFTLVASVAIAAQFIYAGMIVALVRGPADAWVLPVGAALAALIPGTVVFVLCRRLFGPIGLRFTDRAWRAMLPAAFTLGFASLMSMTYDKTGTVLLGYLRSEAEVGMFTAAYKIMFMASAFLPLLGQVLLPAVAAETADKGFSRVSASSYLRLFWFASIPTVIGGLFVAKPLCALVLGKGFPGAASLFLLMLPNIFAMGLASYFAGMRLMISGRNAQYVGAVAAGAASNLVGNAILIPLLGASGAGAMLWVSQATVAGAAAWMGRDIPGPSLARGAGLPILCSAAMGAVLFGLGRLPGRANVLVLIAAGAASYMGAFFVLRTLMNHPKR